MNSGLSVSEVHCPNKYSISQRCSDSYELINKRLSQCKIISMLDECVAKCTKYGVLREAKTASHRFYRYRIGTCVCFFPQIHLHTVFCPFTLRPPSSPSPSHIHRTLYTAVLHSVLSISQCLSRVQWNIKFKKKVSLYSMEDLALTPSLLLTFSFFCCFRLFTYCMLNR